MTIPIPPRRELLKRSGVLAVVAAKPNAAQGANPEDALDIYVSLTADGGVYAFNGHVDLGTGIRTALAQIVAEELGVSFDAVEMVLGDTDNTPNQGPTIASETIQITAVPLRLAAAQARREMARLAAAALDCAAEDLTIEDGVARVRNAPEKSVGLCEPVAQSAHPSAARSQCDAKAGHRAPHRRSIGRSHRHSGQGRGHLPLCPRRARPRHAAWPRRASTVFGPRCR